MEVLFGFLDIDECDSNYGRGPCDQTCDNSVGSFTCSCGIGYNLNSDGRTCDDINECTLSNGGKGPCEQKCRNSPGSFICSCDHGYSLTTDERTCSDVNECTGTPRPCSQICNDIEGGYSCSCWEGFKKHSTNRKICIAPADITPSMLRVTAESSSTMRLQWSIPRYPWQITRQYVYVNGTEDAHVTDQEEIGIGNRARSFRVNNLMPYTNYTFWLVAVINEFRSNKSEPVTQRTLEGTPTAPQNVKLMNISWHELRATWEHPEQFQGPSEGYVIKLYSSGERSNEAAPIGPVNSTEYIFSGLHAATEYTVEVQASNGKNNGPAGNDTTRTSDGCK
ncbi:fibulin-2-like [Branchiostoma lanceolatum]|uniref:fibulin-2-like n=1 Tax=Branchiostoma lanceolatum TaxID=7740 RepID=UPI003457042A